MTKSELIARLAQRYPQLVAKDAEYAVKMILDAMTQSLLSGQRIEIRGFGSFGLNYRPPRTGRNPEVGREGAGAGEVRAALQGRQGAARARRLRRPRRPPRPQPQRASQPVRLGTQEQARHAHRHLDDPPRRVRRCWSRSRAKNAEPVTLRFYFDLAWQAPLVARAVRRSSRWARCSACSRCSARCCASAGRSRVSGASPPPAPRAGAARSSATVPPI